jgi:FkbM family methyltransferase
MKRHLIRLVKVLDTLGLINGCQVYYEYLFYRLFRSRKWDLRQIRLRPLSRPIWLRPGVSDWIAMERIFMDHEYDPISPQHDDYLNQIERAIVARGQIPVIIDCGANIGLSSIWLAERFPSSVVISVEPEPENYSVLARNASNFTRIIPVNAAVSDRQGRVALFNHGDTPWAWNTYETNSGEISAISIPHLIAQNKDYSLMVVKVDIEGFEVNLLRSQTEWVETLPLLIFEMHDWRSPWAGTGHSFFSALARVKRDYLIKGENIFSYLHSTEGPLPPIQAYEDVFAAAK